MNAVVTITLLLAVSGILATIIVSRSWAFTRAYNRRITEEENEFIEEPQMFLDKGYIFCTLFTIEDVRLCASDMGLYLTRLECLKVVSVIKQEFNPEVGINNSVIRQAIKRIQEDNMKKFQRDYTDYEN